MGVVSRFWLGPTDGHWMSDHEKEYALWCSSSQVLLDIMFNIPSLIRLMVYAESKFCHAFVHEYIWNILDWITWRRERTQGLFSVWGQQQKKKGVGGAKITGEMMKTTTKSINKKIWVIFFDSALEVQQIKHNGCKRSSPNGKIWGTSRGRRNVLCFRKSFPPAFFSHFCFLLYFWKSKCWYHIIWNKMW